MIQYQIIKDPKLTDNFEVSLFSKADLSDEEYHIWSQMYFGKEELPRKDTKNFKIFYGKLSAYLKNIGVEKKVIPFKKQKKSSSTPKNKDTKSNKS